MSVVIEFVETLQEKTKETYYTSAFLPNFANKLFSSAARSVKKEPLLEVLKSHSEDRMEILDLAKLFALIERQQKDKKVCKKNDYVNDKEDLSLVLLLCGELCGAEGERGSFRGRSVC